jgi:hypothetical protein
MEVEVFKTDVTDPQHAMLIVDEIQKTYPDYSANFDLADCDRILRVKAAAGDVESSKLIKILKQFGFEAEVLPDDIPHLI